MLKKYFFHALCDMIIKAVTGKINDKDLNFELPLGANNYRSAFVLKPYILFPLTIQFMFL